MNDWRSSFFGANDHEADLEQAFVVLEDSGDGDPIPRWFGCAAHDYAGDDLRRRWDDPTLYVRGGPPGDLRRRRLARCRTSRQGEYVTPVPLPALRPVHGVLSRGCASCGATSCARTTRATSRRASKTALSIPFIDYARGDGLAVGPGGDVEWTPIVVDDTTGWIDGFRGLWGLDTKDRFAGERAPAGPKYTRSATARQSWNDPLGFLGLDKSRAAASRACRPARSHRDPRSRAGGDDAEADARAVDIRRASAAACRSATPRPKPRPVRPRRNWRSAWPSPSSRPSEPGRHAGRRSWTRQARARRTPKPATPATRERTFATTIGRRARGGAAVRPLRGAVVRDQRRRPADRARRDALPRGGADLGSSVADPRRLCRPSRRRSGVA